MTPLDGIDPLPWVRIVPLAAAFAIHCEGKCKATDLVYFAGALKDPAMLKRVHDSHRDCKEGA